jgi:hypothetical protein
MKPFEHENVVRVISLVQRRSTGGVYYARMRRAAGMLVRFAGRRRDTWNALPALPFLGYH